MKHSPAIAIQMRGITGAILHGTISYRCGRLQNILYKNKIWHGWVQQKEKRAEYKTNAKCDIGRAHHTCHTSTENFRLPPTPTAVRPALCCSESEKSVPKTPLIRHRNFGAPSGQHIWNNLKSITLWDISCMPKACWLVRLVVLRHKQFQRDYCHQLSHAAVCLSQDSIALLDRLWQPR